MSDGVEPRPEPTAARGATDLADGEWHRLHPATPLLRGGLAFVAIVGIVIANLRERIVEVFFPSVVCPGGDCEGVDPFEYLIVNNLIVLVLLVVLVVLLLLIGGFALSWRMNTFRITDEVVETRTGILFRTHRQARLDRIQDVTVVRPLFARLFGAARLEIGVAGQGTGVPLAYLGGAQADALRAVILRRAAGARAGETPSTQPAAAGSVVDRRVQEFLAPELDPALATPGSVVRMGAGRLVASTFLSTGTIVAIVVAVAFAVISVIQPRFLFVVAFSVIPAAIGLVSYLVNRITKFLRYSIAGTADGVRVGYGLLTLRNDTIPPGRIHSVAVSQPLLWRPAGWWSVRVNKATRGAQSENGQQPTSTVLPVGSADDVFEVLRLLLPQAPDADVRGLLERGLVGRGDDEFTTSPPRAAVLRLLSWRRNGFALLPDLVVLRRGFIWRELVIVPLARVQSVAAGQGPLERALDLGAVHVHTVAGPITAKVGALARTDAEGFLRDASDASVAAAAADRSHRWRSGEDGPAT